MVTSVYAAVLQLTLLLFGQLYQQIIRLDVSVETLCRVNALKSQQELLKQAFLLALWQLGICLHVFFQVCVAELEDEKQIVPIVVHI